MLIDNGGCHPPQEEQATVTLEVRSKVLTLSMTLKCRLVNITFKWSTLIRLEVQIFEWNSQVYFPATLTCLSCNVIRPGIRQTRVAIRVAQS